MAFTKWRSKLFKRWVKQPAELQECPAKQAPNLIPRKETRTMKKSSIQIGNSYEIQVGKNTTKVKVASFDEKHGTWLCDTEGGKTLRIKDAARFLKEVKLKEKKSLREVIESKGITIIPKGRRATSTMRDLDDQRADAGSRMTPDASHGRPSKQRQLKADRLEETGRQPSAATRGPKPLGEMSALDAAHRVLVEAKHPMRIREITETAIANNYCTLHGKTPHCTINGGIQREIAKKGGESRFVWVDKGLLAAR